MGSYCISGVISRVTMIITHIRGLIPPLITTHEPPSSVPKEHRRDVRTLKSKTPPEGPAY